MSGGQRYEVVGTGAGEVLVEVQPDGQVVCGWYALCDHPAAGVVEHSILGYVPACERCVGKLGLELLPFVQN